MLIYYELFVDTNMITDYLRVLANLLCFFRCVEYFVAGIIASELIMGFSAIQDSGQGNI